MKNISQRIGIFLDTANIYHSVKHLHKGNINFLKLLKLLINDRILIRATAYTISADAQKEKDFILALNKSGFKVKAKKLQIFSGGLKKGNWDIGMAIDAVKMSKKLDVAIIISGDGDFTDLVDYLQHEGLWVEVAGFGASTSNELKEKADIFIDLDNHKDLIIKNPINKNTKDYFLPYDILEK